MHTFLIWQVADNFVILEEIFYGIITASVQQKQYTRCVSVISDNYSDCKQHSGMTKYIESNSTTVRHTVWHIDCSVRSCNCQDISPTR